MKWQALIDSYRAMLSRLETDSDAYVTVWKEIRRLQKLQLREAA